MVEATTEPFMACNTASFRRPVEDLRRRLAAAGLCSAMPFLASSSQIRSHSCLNFSFNRSKASPLSAFGN